MKPKQRPYRLRDRTPDKMPSDPTPAEIAQACEVLKTAHLAEMKQREGPGPTDGNPREFSERELWGD